MADARELALEGARKWVEEHPDEFREAVERGERDLKFALEHMQEWRRKHPNRWVAVHGGKLVAVESDAAALHEAICKQGIPPRESYVKFIPDARTVIIPG